MIVLSSSDSDVSAHRVPAPLRAPPASPIQGRGVIKIDLNLSDSCPEEPPASEPFMASSLVRSTSRKLCQSDINTNKRAKYANKILLQVARKTGRDDLLVRALSTEIGQKTMPLCAHAFGQHEHFKILAANTTKLLSEAGGRHKLQIAHMLSAGLPKSFLKRQFNMNSPLMQRVKERLVIEDQRSLQDASYAENVTRDKTPEGMSTVFGHFFSRSTHQCSGSDQQKTRIMSEELYEWEADLQSQWPGMLRELADNHPHLVPNLEDIPKTGWTDFEACLLSAVHASPPDAALEKSTQYKAFIDKYLVKLATKRGCLRPASKTKLAQEKETRRQRTDSRLRQDTFDPAAYKIEAPSLATFRRWLLKNGLRYTRVSNPHPCPLCIAGPTDEVVYEALAKEVEALKIADKPVPPELDQRCKKLLASLKMYRIHLTQLETCRAQVKKAEENLIPGVAMVIRDFVNHHDHGGKHVKCLHWVLMWRDKEGGPIIRLKLRHYCSDPKSMSTDSYFQADVADFHLDGLNAHCPGLFRKFHTIIFVGDHGPHFASHDTMYNESTLLRRFGKHIIIMFLTSYHAYSRADASGAEDSTALRRDLRCGMARFGSAAMTEMTNSSHDRSSWAYDFPAINRNKGVFPADKDFKHKSRAKWIKKWCEVKFTHPALEEAYDGVVQYRIVPGQGDWQWTDLVANRREPDQMLCDSCSTKAQKMVLHVDTECPAPEYIHNLPEFVHKVPDPTRIQGKQVLGKKAAGMAGTKKTTSYACKYTLCAHHTNRRKAFHNPVTANRHMKLIHRPTDTEYEHMMYPVAGLEDNEPQLPSKKAKRGRKKKKKKKTVHVEQDKTDSESGTDLEPGSADAGKGGREDQEEAKANSGRQRKKTGRKDAAAEERTTSESAPSQSDDEEDDADGAGEDVNHEALSDSEGDAAELEDPNEDVDIEEDQYVVEAIVSHKLLSTGHQSYQLSWQGYDKTTWEPARVVNKQLRDEYHRALETKIAAEDAARSLAHEANWKAAGSRSSRSRQNKNTSAARKVLVEDKAQDYRDKGWGYHQSYEEAERVVPL